MVDNTNILYPPTFAFSQPNKALVCTIDFFIGKLHMYLVGLESTTSPSNQLSWEKEVPVEL